MTKNEIREAFWNDGLAIQATSHEEAVMIAEALDGLPTNNNIVGWWETSPKYELEVCKGWGQVCYMQEFGWHVANGMAKWEANISDLLAGTHNISIQAIDDLI